MIAQNLTEPVVEKRRDRLRAMMRQDILDAARGIMHSLGIRELTMRALAKAVGVTAPTLYDYFDSKERVLDALYLEGIGRLHQQFIAAVSEHSPGTAQLAAIAGAYRAFAHEDPELFQLIFGRIDQSYVPEPSVKASARVLFDMLVDAIIEAVRAGEIRDIDPISGAVGLWTSVHGIVVLEISGFLTNCSPNGPDATFSDTLRLHFEGFKPAS